ncbi:MAG: hypothetical protein B6D53_04720 [Candidatus Omnitrophica bacterium 4484_49]|nr:MAG: hypothetical protein B6D53_04720 [Candidatus Omnitrophica bacterium 4484_49]
MGKELRRIFRRRVIWFFSEFFIFLCKKLSLNSIYKVGSIIGKLSYYMAFSHRKIALNSLSIAFPETSLKRRREIAKDFSVIMMQSFLEVIHFVNNPSLFHDVKIEGKEFLNKALEKKRGVIALTAHFGNFPLISLKLAREGYRINAVVRPMRDRNVENYVQNLRTKAGVNTIYSHPRRQCVVKIIKALRNNEIVMIHMDQNFSSTGVWVKFFGKLAATPVGPVVLALRTKAPILPMFIIREGIGKHCLKILPELELDYFPEREKTVLINTIKITRLTERWIKKYPEYWGWIHKRWKSQPSEEVRKMKFKIHTDEIDRELYCSEGYVGDSISYQKWK